MGRNIYLRTAAIIVLLLLPPAQASHAFDSGLEIESHKRMYVVIEELVDGDRQAGLTKELIRAKVELQLRRNGINPNAKPENNDGYLNVNVNVVRNAYHFDVRFKRIVMYSSEGRRYETVASVWEKSGNGTFARDPLFILQHLADGLDVFINAYLKANQK